MARGFQNRRRKKKFTTLTSLTCTPPFMTTNGTQGAPDSPPLYKIIKKLHYMEWKIQFGPALIWFFAFWIEFKGTGHRVSGAASKMSIRSTIFLFFFPSQVLPECSLRSYWMYELTEIHNGEVTLHSVLTQNEAICAAVEKSRDYILITNKNHMIRVSFCWWLLETDSNRAEWKKFFMPCDRKR